MKPTPTAALLATALLAASGCATTRKYQDRNMDFGAIKTVAVLPFTNLSRDSQGAERVRDVFSNALLASGAVYVLPQGEVARGIVRVTVATPNAPAKDEIVKLGSALSADAVITGVLKEYGEVRSGAAAANAISLSVQMYETSTGKIVWAASTTKGGVGVTQRLLGGGGEPMNEVTEAAVNELLGKLFN